MLLDKRKKKNTEWATWLLTSPVMETTLTKQDNLTKIILVILLSVHYYDADVVDDVHLQYKKVFWMIQFFFSNEISSKMWKYTWKILENDEILFLFLIQCSIEETPLHAFRLTSTCFKGMLLYNNFLRIEGEFSFVWSVLITSADLSKREYL